MLGVTQGVPGAAGGSGPLTYSKTTNDTNNAIDKVQTEIQQAPGKINRLSVAVLLDSGAVQAERGRRLDQADPGRGRLRQDAR